MRLDAQKIEAFLNQALHTEYETEQKEFEKYKRITGWDNTYRIKKIEELEKISQQDIIQYCHHILSEIPDTQNIHPILNRFLGFSYHNYKIGHTFLNCFSLSLYEDFYLRYFILQYPLYTTIRDLMSDFNLSVNDVLDQLKEFYVILGIESLQKIKIEIIKSYLDSENRIKIKEYAHIVEFIFSLTSLEDFLKNYQKYILLPTDYEIYKVIALKNNQLDRIDFFKENLIKDQDNAYFWLWLNVLLERGEDCTEFMNPDFLLKQAEKLCNNSLLKKWANAVKPLYWKNNQIVDEKIIVYLLDSITHLPKLKTESEWHYNEYLICFSHFYQLLHPQSQYQLDYDLIDYFFVKKHENQANTLYLLQLRSNASALLKAVNLLFQKNKTKYDRVNQVIDACLLTGQPEALQFIFETARSFPKPSIREHAEFSIQFLARKRQCNICEIADQAIPTLDFDHHHQQILSYGEGKRQFILQLEPDLSIKILNENQKVLKSLPDANVQESMEKVKQQKIFFAQLKKSLTYTTKFQQNALFDAMCVARQWSAPDWKKYFMDHPIMGILIQSIFYIEHRPDQKPRIFRAEYSNLIDLEDEDIELNETSTIQIAHTILCDRNIIDQCLQHLKDYKIKPFLNQFPQVLIENEIDFNHLNIEIPFDSIQHQLGNYNFTPESTHIGNSEVKFFFRDFNYNQFRVKLKTIPYSPYEIINFEGRQGTMVTISKVEVYEIKQRHDEVLLDIERIPKPLRAEIAYICKMLS